MAGIRRSCRVVLRLSGQHGSLRTVIPDGKTIVSMLDAMAEDNDCNILWNRGQLLEQWRRGGVRVAALAETSAMLHGRVDESIFLPGRGWLLPAFVSADAPGTPIKLLWVAPRLRRRGIGSGLVRRCPFLLPLAKDVLPSALPFWRAVRLKM